LGTLLAESDAFPASPSFSSDLAWFMHGNVTPCSHTNYLGMASWIHAALDCDQYVLCHALYTCRNYQLSI